MAETQPMMLQELCYTAADFRLQLDSLVCDEGVADVSGGSLLVTTGGAGLDLSVAEGAAFIDSDAADQGMYSVFNDGPVTVTATTADGTNPRIDQVIATVYDSQLSGSDDFWELSVLAGTPTGGASLSNLNGAAALPDRSIRLAYVLVPASFAGPFVNATHILDARATYGRCDRPESDQKTLISAANPTSTANVSMTDLNMSFTVTGTDDVVWVDIDAVVGILTANGTNEIELLVDGVANTKLLVTRADNNILRVSGYKKWRLTGLAAGTHTIAFRTRSGAAATNTTVLATATGASYWKQ